MENMEMNNAPKVEEKEPVIDNAKITFAGETGEVSIKFTLNTETNQLDYTVNTDKMKESDKLANFLADTFMGMLTQLDQSDDPSEGLEEETEKK